MHSVVAMLFVKTHLLMDDRLNFCSGSGIAVLNDALNLYYRLNGAVECDTVECEACELFKYLMTNFIFLAIAS